ncbi:uncharacterized protein LOC114446219 [Parambassis ranga]|uniref:Uncharacterized protein LOC114446219 n=1 Tax=Parambassis ranga TaxID=210632 RepID=A0A6P7JKW1_9TELE|nr:uncharacterized protein LOC114446219 [Parambassis ranga]
MFGVDSGWILVLRRHLISAARTAVWDSNMDGIDDSYIWLRRIAHGIRYQRGAVPFPECVRVGLDFNAAVEREEKLDRSLLTNGVMLEICEFAKTVTKSEKYFLFEMLEFNFDLGVDTDNDRLCYAYLSRVHGRIRQLKELIKSKPGRWKEVFALPDLQVLSADSEVSTGSYPKWKRMVDSSLLTGGGGGGQSLGSSSSTCMSRNRTKRAGSAFRFCAELGVRLAVGPNQTTRQKLDRNLLTSGVMLELLHFCRVLCGTQVHMVYELVRQNFGFELDKVQFRLNLNRLTERRQLTGADRDAFRREPFQHHTATKTRKRRPPDTEQEAADGQQWGALRERLQDGDLSYTCPIDCETEDRPSNPGTPGKKMSRRIKQEEEGVSVSPQIHRHNPCSPAAQPNHASPERSCRQKLWQRRAAQSVLTADGNGTFACCRRIGLDFNVSSGGKRKLDLRLLTNGVLQEVYRFANAMSRSTRSFLFDILRNNFHLSLQDVQQERDFIFCILIKEKFLQSSPDRHSPTFLSTPFQISETYIPIRQEVGPQDDTSAESRQADLGTHPYCRKLGLDLWSTEERPAGQKLDLTALTVGSMLEMVAFVRELCGTAYSIVSDVLEHNFELDLQCGKTEAAQVIRQWYATNKTHQPKRTSGWLDALVPLNGHAQPSPPGGGHDRKPGRKTEAVTCTLEDPLSSYPLCRQVGLNLNIHRGAGPKQKLDLRVLTRAMLVEVHRYVQRSSMHYVPALYAVLEHNFDLSSQSHRKVEFAWAVASQVIAMAAKSGRTAAYQNTVFELPFEGTGAACKEEPEDGDSEPDGGSDIVFVRTLKPVDILVEVD